MHHRKDSDTHLTPLDQSIRMQNDGFHKNFSTGPKHVFFSAMNEVVKKKKKKTTQARFALDFSTNITRM